MDNDNKAWWQSKTVWGGLIALAAGILAAFGFTLSPEDQNTLVNIVVGITGAVGGLIAVVGRVKASKKVGK